MQLHVKRALHQPDRTRGSYEQVVLTEAAYREPLDLEDVRYLGNVCAARRMLRADLFVGKVACLTRLLRRHQGIKTLLVVQFHP